MQLLLIVCITTHFHRVSSCYLYSVCPIASCRISRQAKEKTQVPIWLERFPRKYGRRQQTKAFNWTRNKIRRRKIFRRFPDIIFSSIWIFASFRINWTFFWLFLSSFNSLKERYVFNVFQESWFRPIPSNSSALAIKVDAFSVLRPIMKCFRISPLWIARFSNNNENILRCLSSVFHRCDLMSSSAARRWFAATATWKGRRKRR